MPVWWNFKVNSSWKLQWRNYLHFLKISSCRIENVDFTRGFIQKKIHCVKLTIFNLFPWRIEFCQREEDNWRETGGWEFFLYFYLTIILTPTWWSDSAELKTKQWKSRISQNDDADSWRKLHLHICRMNSQKAIHSCCHLDSVELMFFSMPHDYINWTSECPIR